jgi:hypothetical protein
LVANLEINQKEITEIKGVKLPTYPVIKHLHIAFNGNCEELILNARVEKQLAAKLRALPKYDSEMYDVKAKPHHVIFKEGELERGNLVRISNGFGEAFVDYEFEARLRYERKLVRLQPKIKVIFIKVRFFMFSQ